MGLVDSGSAYDDTVIPQDMYEGTYEELHTYRREDDELRLNFVFRVKYEDKEVEKIFNTPNKLSINPDAQRSKQVNSKRIQRRRKRQALKQQRRNNENSHNTRYCR